MKFISKSKHNYIVSIPKLKNKFSEQIKWCEQIFGPTGSMRTDARWRHGWSHNENTFYFKSKHDALWFMMQWSDNV